MHIRHPGQPPGPLRTIVEPPASEQALQLANLCLLLNQSLSQSRLSLDASGRLCHTRSHRRGRRVSNQSRLGPATDIVPLERVLSNSCRLSLKQSTKLALNLASSLIQLHSTNWRHSNWNKTVIEFFQSRYPISITYLEQPLLSKVFDRSTINSAISANSSITAREDLLDLGILLLEIWHQKTFESFTTESESVVPDTSYYSRMPVAIRWFDLTADDLPLKYRDVVSRCVRFSFEGCTPSWEDGGFRRLVCQNVVVPLHETCRVWEPKPSS
jgi:hypothetical protein